MRSDKPDDKPFITINVVLLFEHVYLTTQYVIISSIKYDWICHP